MKIVELKTLIREYEQTWNLHKMLYREPEEIEKIRLFAKKLENKSDDYELNTDEIFNLLKIASRKNVPLLKKIRNSFADFYFFDLFNSLMDDNFLNEKIFSSLYHSRLHTQRLLFELFHQNHFAKNIQLPSETLDMIISLSQEENSSESIKECFVLLKKRNMINEFSLKLLKNKNFYSVFVVIQELDKINQLNDAYLDLMINCDQPFYLIPLIALLSQAQITIDYKLFKLICLNKSLLDLTKIVKILLDADLLKIEFLIMILSANDIFYLYKRPIFYLLQKNGLLNEKIFIELCSKEVRYSFEQSLEILDKNELIKTSNELIYKLLNNEIDSYDFYHLISYLNKSQLLHHQTIADFIKLIIQPNQAISSLFNQLDEVRYYVNQDQLNDLLLLSIEKTKQLGKLIHSLNNNKFQINKKNFSNLMSLSYYKLQMLANLVDKFNKINFYIGEEDLEKLFALSGNNLDRLNTLCHPDNFDQLIFAEIIKRITIKLPPVEAANAIKHSRKTSGLPRSEIIINSTMNFFTEHSPLKNYESGGYGKVKKGYNLPDDENILYSLKKLHSINPVKSQQEAMREVKFNRLLGRKSYYYTKGGRSTLVTEWHKEKGLHLFKAHDIMQESFQKRLQCLITALTDLNLLHSHYRVHGDIKPHNLILDFKTASLKLIDFGASHKKNSTKNFAWTPKYTDTSEAAKNNYDFCDDVYSMGIITAYFFPEIFTILEKTNELHISIKNKFPFSLQERAIITLMKSMVHTDRNMRCTSEDALYFCRTVLNNFSHLNKTTLNKIMEDSIHRSITTVEDILRGKIRPKAEKFL